MTSNLDDFLEEAAELIEGDDDDDDDTREKQQKAFDQLARQTREAIDGGGGR